MLPHNQTIGEKKKYTHKHKKMQCSISRLGPSHSRIIIQEQTFVQEVYEKKTSVGIKREKSVCLVKQEEKNENGCDLKVLVRKCLALLSNRHKR